MDEAVPSDSLAWVLQNTVAVSPQKSWNTGLSILHVTKLTCPTPEIQHLTSLYNYSSTILT